MLLRRCQLLEPRQRLCGDNVDAPMSIDTHARSLRKPIRLPWHSSRCIRSLLLRERCACLHQHRRRGRPLPGAVGLKSRGINERFICRHGAMRIKSWWWSGTTAALLVLRCYRSPCRGAVLLVVVLWRLQRARRPPGSHREISDSRAQPLVATRLLLFSLRPRIRCRLCRARRRCRRPILIFLRSLRRRSRRTRTYHVFLLLDVCVCNRRSGSERSIAGGTTIDAIVPESTDADGASGGQRGGYTRGVGGLDELVMS